MDQYEATTLIRAGLLWSVVFGANDRSYEYVPGVIFTPRTASGARTTNTRNTATKIKAVFDPTPWRAPLLTRRFSETFRAGYAMVNRESGETVTIPLSGNRTGTYVRVSLELNAGGSCYFESTTEYSDGTFDLPIMRGFSHLHHVEDGRNYYASAWTMGGEGHVWLLLELEEAWSGWQTADFNGVKIRAMLGGVKSQTKQLVKQSF